MRNPETGQMARRRVQSDGRCGRPKTASNICKLNILNLVQWIPLTAKRSLKNHFGVSDANRKCLPCQTEDGENNEHDAENAKRGTNNARATNGNTKRIEIHKTPAGFRIVTVEWSGAFMDLTRHKISDRWRERASLVHNS